MRTRPNAKVRTKQPPSSAVVKRRAVLMEAGIEHGAAAEAIQKRDGIPTSRQTVTAVINGHFPSGGLRVERHLVEMVQEAFRKQGKEKRAETITLDYMGWGSGNGRSTARERVA